MIGEFDRKITLELNRSGIQARIPVRQGDSLVYRVAVNLTSGGKSVFPKGVAWAQVCALLPDGERVSADCDIEPGGIFTFIPGAGFFKNGGPVLCRLVLRGDDGGELYSPMFAFDAENCFDASGATVPADEYSRMEAMLLQMLEAQRICQESAAEAKIYAPQRLQKLCYISVGNVDYTIPEISVSSVGECGVSVTSPKELMVSFPRPLKRLALMSAHLGAPSGVVTSTIALDIYVNGMDTRTTSISSAVSAAGDRFGTLYLDMVDLFRSYTGQAAAQGNPSHARHSINYIEDILSDVTSIDCIRLLLRGNISCFISGGMFKIYGQYA